MNFTANNIAFVKRQELDGMTYSWFVALKSGRVSDTRSYINYNEDGKTCIKPYEKELLPKAVQKFINTHSESVFTEDEDNKFIVYIIR